MNREKNKATCRRFIQKIFNDGDLSSIGNFISPDSLHHEIGEVSLPSRRGPEWFAEMVSLYRLAFPDLYIEIQDQVAENDRVVTCLRMQGTQKGPLMGIGVSGKSVDITRIRVDRLTEGKIAESWFHWDGLRMLQQIGALPNLDRQPQVASLADEALFPPIPMRFPTPRPQAEMPLPSSARLKPAA